MRAEMLPLAGKVKYLGQMITFVDQETTEVQHRIRCASSAFTKHRQELTLQSYFFRHRLPLCDAVVTPTMKYGGGTKATTKESEKMLRTTQRRMLRLITQKKKIQQKRRRKLKEKTLITMKSARRLKKKSAHMMNGTKTTVFHPMLMKTAQQDRAISKTGLNKKKYE